MKGHKEISKLQGGVQADDTMPIAIVGMSFQFPDEATSEESFWAMLMEGRSASRDFPADRLNGSALYHPDRSRGDSLPLRGGHFLSEKLGAFDAPFFSISASEAVAMDPQSRALLETTYRALENAGMSLEKVSNSNTSVYTGNLGDDYKFFSSQDLEQNSKYTMVGMTGLLSGRLSWFFNLKGPNLTLDTACSSSSVALDLGCQNLYSGTSDMSIVTGCSLLFAPNFFHLLSNMGMLSPDSKCFSFDHRANGYGRGEGIAALILKRLPDALRDGDTIRAVIRSTGTNHDGRTPGVTQPNERSQSMLIQNTYAKAGLDMLPTRYVEAHGTGTPVGDPIEASAIGDAFRGSRTSQDPLYIGSVKSNIGHLEGASGLASVIKAVLVLEHGIIPRNANFECLNPKIDDKALNIKVPNTASIWPTEGLRRASVNSFGASGTNAHVVLDDAYHYLSERGLIGNHSTCVKPLVGTSLLSDRGAAEGNIDSDVLERRLLSLDVCKGEMLSLHDPQLDDVSLNGTFTKRAHKPYNSLEYGITPIQRLDQSCAAPSGSHNNRVPSKGSLPEAETSFPRILFLSASDKAALQRVSNFFDEWINKNIPNSADFQTFLDNISYTLAQRRSLLPYRSFALIDTRSALRQIKSQLCPAIRAVTQPKIAFVFTGQGAQWAGMGKELLHFSVFHDAVTTADDFLRNIGCQWSVMDMLCNAVDDMEIHRPELSQTICTVLQIAIIDFYRSLKIYPAAVVGHSSGEIAAAYCAGAISKHSALKLAYFRGVTTERSQKDAKGGMMAVAMSESQITPLIAGIGSSLTVACINSPNNVTISGEKNQLEALANVLQERNIFHRQLRVDVAYHSPRMKSSSIAYAHAAGSLESGEANHEPCVMISSVTGELADTSILCQVDYWMQNMLQPVLFSNALTRLCCSAAPTQQAQNGSPRYQAYIQLLVEIGPHAALQSAIHDNLKIQPATNGITYYSTLKRQMPADKTFLGVIGHLVCHGFKVNHDLVASISSVAEAPRHQRQAIANLPEYPFDHSHTYMPAGRLGKEFRFRRNIRLDLLGKPVLDWNPLNPRWTHFLKVSELSWVADHKINGSIIYPAVGMLVMAIEAANQVADPGRPVNGIKLTDVYFSAALTVPESAEGIETQLALRPLRSDADRISSSWIFDLYSCKKGQWQEHGHGKVHVEYSESYSELDKSKEGQKKLKSAQDLHSIVERNAISRRTGDEFYTSAYKSGYTFGPSFKAMDDLAFSEEFGHQTTANVKCFQWEAIENTNHFQPHIVHPTTLDCMLQTSLAAFSRAGQDVVPTAIPAELEYLWISTSAASYPNADFVRSRGHIVNRSNTGYETAVTALDQSSTKVVLDARGIKLRFVTGTSSTQQNPDPHSCYTIDWKADIELLGSGFKLNSLKEILPDETLSEPTSQSLLINYLALSTFKRPDMKILHINSTPDYRQTFLLKQIFGVEGRHTSMLPCAEFASMNYDTVRSDLQNLDPEPTTSSIYDLVLVSCKAHSKGVISHADRLLKESGKMVLFNGYQVASDIEAILPQAAASDKLMVTPKSGTDDWRADLQKCGLVQIEMHADNIVEGWTLMTSSKRSQTSASARSLHYVLVCQGTEYQDKLASSLQLAFKDIGLPCEKCYPHQMDVAANSLETTYIFLAELDQPYLENISSEDYIRLRHILASAKGVLWLTRRNQNGLLPPSGAIVDGLARVLRAERNEIVFVTANLEKSSTQDQVGHIMTLVRVTDFGSTDQKYESSYTQVNGQFHIGRMVVAKEASKDIPKISFPCQSKVQAFSTAPPLKMAISTPGLLDSLHFVEDFSVENVLAPDEVEIRVTHIGLNFKDLLLALGRIDGTTFGNECAGVINRAGMSTDFKVGERVCVLSATAFSAYTRVPAPGVVRVPDALSLAHAAAVPTQFVTAWHAIHNIAKLQKGETILIHSAAGGTGQVAVQIAQLLGGEVFATVGSEEKKRFIISTYDIDESHIFNSRSTVFAESIRRMTQGVGVDVVLNSLSGESLLASWDLIAPYGRFVELGKKDIAMNSNLPMSPFLRCATFTAFDTGIMATDHAAMAKDMIEHLLRLLVEKVLRPVNDFKVLSISEVQRGMRMLQSGHMFGKVVFEITNDALVPTTIKTKSTWSLDENKTYVIAGGSGGLGRSIAEWMVKKKGARNLLLLSRSGLKSEAAAKLTSELRVAGARIEATECDICDGAALRFVLEHYGDKMPPFGGCIQSSMVLKDGLFANMTYEDWRASTDPKIMGSWNLHTILPKGLDFFILLSSIAGVIGSAGQANYAAGNTYMDALAHYRKALGERATALDLGVILEQGVLASNDSLRERILAQGFLAGISNAELFGLLDYYCNPNRAIVGPADAQLAIGLTHPSNVRAKVHQGFGPFMSLPFYRHIFNGTSDADQEHGSKDPTENARRDFVAAGTMTEAGAVVSRALIQRLIKNTPGLQDRIDAADALDEPIQYFGVDSLQAIELRSWFAKEFAADVPIFEILGDGTLRSIGVFAAMKSELR